jgi:hypothetical protein
MPHAETLSGCPRIIGCEICKILEKEFGKNSVNLAIRNLGPTASETTIRAYLTQGKPNPENS